VQPENVHVQQNVSVTLQCEAVGGSNIIYTWKKDDDTILQTLDNSGDLVIDAVQESDEGMYRCEAMNHRNEVAVSNKVNFVVYGKQNLSN